MESLENIIQFLKQNDELQSAKHLLKTFEKYASNIIHYDQLGRLFYDVKAYQDAIICAERTLSLSKTTQEAYSARSNLAKLYNHVNSPHQSLIYIKSNKLINPSDYEMKMEELFSYYLLSDFEKSYQIVIQILADDNAPKTVKDRCEFNHGSYLLDDNKFQEGLKKFIGVGHEIGIWPKINFPSIEWSGDIIPNKNIAILSEGGIGDEIINIRFMQNIKELGMNPIFITNRKDTSTIFNRLGFKTVKSTSMVPLDSEFVLSMFLPIKLNISANDLWHGPYLKPDQKYIEKWKEIFSNINGKKVALRWKGNPNYEQDLHRSIPLDILNEELDFNRSDITFISVQKDNYEGIEKYLNIINVADKLETLDDLMGCLYHMDHTISSCTSVAHIAAACGFPITVCPPVATYYTWLGNTKWYGDNCKIVRQRKWNDWSHLKGELL